MHNPGESKKGHICQGLQPGQEEGFEAFQVWASRAWALTKMDSGLKTAKDSSWVRFGFGLRGRGPCGPGMSWLGTRKIRCVSMPFEGICGSQIQFLASLLANPTAAHCGPSLRTPLIDLYSSPPLSCTHVPCQATGIMVTDVFRVIRKPSTMP